MRINEIAATVVRGTPRLGATKLVAVDGPGGAGKSTLAARLASEWHEIAPPDVLILEGVSSARATVRDRLSLSIWVETPAGIRLTRGLERDGADALTLWQRWMSIEDAHFAADRTRDHADVIVSGQ